MSVVKLESKDGIVFEVEYEVIRKCETIKQMYEDLGMKNGADECVRLPNVKGAALEKVIEWCKFHKEKPVDVVNGMQFEIWDKNFLSVDQLLLLDILSAANYLIVNDLMKITSLKVANMIRGRKGSEINELLNIECDFNEEELKQVELENTWLRDE